MTLVDAGPLVALINKGDASHPRCVLALGRLNLPLVTTGPALNRAMDYLGERVGWDGQRALWDMTKSGALELAETSPAMYARMTELMAKYQGVPMDLAAASLVALAEERGLDRIFTLDRGFTIYRLPPHFRKRLTPIP